MKQNLQQYIHELKSYNQTHRVIGSNDADLLVSQSLEAIHSFKKNHLDVIGLVDVGAGAGLLGIPWLLLQDNHKTIFIEPSKKKIAFLYEYLSKTPELLKRIKILPFRLEDVSRETITSFFDKANYIYAARAFSGNQNLAETVMASEFLVDKSKFFTFSNSGTRPKSNSYVLNKVFG